MKNIFIIILLLFCFLNESTLAQDSAAKKKIVQFKAVEQQASFPGGEGALSEYVANNIKYPQVALDNVIEGVVYIGFVIKQDGSINNAKIIKDIGANCGRAAMNVVKNMPKWKPAMNNGHAVRSYYTLPVKFALNSEQKRIGEFIDRQNPKFPGGQKALGKFIYTNMHYPDKAQMLGITGTVRVNFIITPEGKVLNARITKEIGGGCGMEALRLVSLMPRWKPGTINGRPSNRSVTLPITFDMRDRKYKRKRRSRKRN